MPVEKHCLYCKAILGVGAFCGSCGKPVVTSESGVTKTIIQGSRPPQDPENTPGSQKPAPAVVKTPIPVPSKPVESAAKSKIAPPPAASDESLIGKRLHQRYLVEAKLGEGGFGTVYRARQVQMDRVVALKVLHPRMSRDANIVGRFRREAKASSHLRAPHTVQVYDFDETPEGTFYLAMEFLQGRSLHAVLSEEKALDLSRVVRILDGIAESLEEAHGLGIVHRDIKPENIFLEDRPHPDFAKVLDFGIAKIVSGDGLTKGPALTAAGQTLGTLEYMSPEQLMGVELDGRSDLYALGILAYEMLTGRHPFPVKTPGDLITAHLRAMPEPPSALRPRANIPREMDALILRLLAKTPPERLAGAAQLRQELRQWQAASGNAPSALMTSPAATIEKSTPNLFVQPTENPTTGSRWWIWLVVGCLVVVAVGAAVGLLLGGASQ